MVLFNDDVNTLDFTNDQCTPAWNQGATSPWRRQFSWRRLDFFFSYITNVWSVKDIVKNKLFLPFHRAEQ
jgi:hypothetical protein